MSLLGGHIPGLPPPPRAQPHREHASEAAQQPSPRAKDWSGWVSPSGILRALRRGARRAPVTGRESRAEWAWVFLCALCGGEREFIPRRLRGTPRVYSCGCGPRGRKAAQKREADRLLRLHADPETFTASEDR